MKKLTAKQRREILKRFKRGASVSDIGDDFIYLSYPEIEEIIRRALKRQKD